MIFREESEKGEQKRRWTKNHMKRWVGQEEGRKISREKNEWERSGGCEERRVRIPAERVNRMLKCPHSKTEILRVKGKRRPLTQSPTAGKD